jgi:hypothetical protein
MGTTTASENAAVRATLVLAIGLELGASEWKMAFSPGLGQPPRHRTVAAGDLEAVKKVDRGDRVPGLPTGSGPQYGGAIELQRGRNTHDCPRGGFCPLPGS